jgi:hypothetical protein
MKAHIRPYVTAGIAIAGASVIAVTPLAAAPQDKIIRANEVPSVTLTATPSELLAQFIGTFDDFLPGGSLAEAADGAGDVIGDLGTALAQASAVLDTTIGDTPAALLQFLDDVASGNPLAFGYAARTAVDLFVSLITPFFNAIEPNLPEAIAAPLRDAFAQFGAAIAQLRNVLVPPPAASTEVAAADLGAADVQDALSGFVDDFIALSSAFGTAIATGATFFGNAPFTLPYLPGTQANPGGLVGLAEAVFANPLALGNAFSIVAGSLLHTPEILLGGTILDDNTPGLLFSAGFPLALAFASILPAPLGPGTNPLTDPGLVLEGSLLFAGVINNFLGLLPEPAIPTTMAAATLAGPSTELAPDASVGGAVNAFGTIVDGFTRAGENFVTANLALGPGLLQIAEAAAAGNRAAVSFGVQQIIDGPLYVTKPLFEAFEAALPEPLGGQEDADPGLVWQSFVRALAVRDAFDDLANNIINPPAASAGVTTLGVQTNRQSVVSSNEDSAVVADTGTGARTLTGGGNAAGDTGSRSQRRSLVNLDVLNLGGARARTEQASAAADNNTSSSDGAGRHRPGVGKDPVTKLVKRLTSGFDRSDGDDNGNSRRGSSNDDG